MFDLGYYEATKDFNSYTNKMSKREKIPLHERDSHVH